MTALLALHKAFLGPTKALHKALRQLAGKALCTALPQVMALLILATGEKVRPYFAKIVFALTADEG